MNTKTTALPSISVQIFKLFAPSLLQKLIINSSIKGSVATGYFQSTKISFNIDNASDQVTLQSCEQNAEVVQILANNFSKLSTGELK